MANERIQFALRERFQAPLRDFYTRRIIFWKDPEREFERDVDELELGPVKIVKLTGCNNFAVKKLLLKDDPDSDFLVYCPLSYDDVQENWLLDIELYSEEFRADFISMQMEELNIAPSAIMRKTVKLYAKFLDSKERRQKLRKIGRTYDAPLPLHLDIMAVLAGVPGGGMQDIVIALLSDSLDKDENTVLQNIEKFGNLDAFWQLIQRYTGYREEESRPLGELAAHILLTAQSQTMNVSIFRGLERFLSDSNQAWCYSLVHEWRSRADNEGLFQLCRQVERELRLPARFRKEEPETLLSGDVFPCINEAILAALLGEASQQVVRPELIQKVCDNRRTAGWFDRFQNYFDALAAIGQMQGLYQAHGGGFHVVEPKKLFGLYTETLYQMDRLYRAFHLAFGNSLRNSNSLLEDPLKHAAEYVEGLYQNWFLRELGQSWCRAVDEDFETLGYVSEIPHQRDFYRKYVAPLTAKKTRAFVIISDALRYEVAAELTEILTRTTKGKAELHAVQSVFPSITKCGMAALLPGKELTFTDSMEVQVDAMPARTTREREAILNRQTDSVAVQYTDLLSMKQAERRQLIAGKNVVYIYHNAIDAIGDKAATETKVFSACETALEELSNLLRIVTNELSGTNVFITADHGFLYTYQPLLESDKLGRSAFEGEVYELGRRYALTSPETTGNALLPIQLSSIYSGVAVQGFAPRDTIRMKLPGGGENYVHGGISLQEITVPVIVFKNLRTTSQNYVEVKNAELGLLSESRKISNLIFSLDFLQRQPVGDKIQPCTYTIYMIDENGNLVSDRQQIIADKTSPQAAQRVFRLRLNLKAGAYDKSQVYRLVIANGVEMEEIEFHIDVAFADDFGFDL